MAKTSEPAFGLAVMQVLAGKPNGETNVQSLIRGVPGVLKLTAQDTEPSLTRPNEQVWEQRVRNLKSHDGTPGNVIAEGFVAHVGRGRYALTTAGWSHLKHKGLA